MFLSILITLLTISSVFAQSEFSMSPLTMTSLSIEGESSSVIGTIFTPRSGVSFTYAYKTDFYLEVGTSLSYARSADIDEDETDSLEYEFLMGGVYTGVNLWRLKPFIGYNQINLEYNYSEEDLVGRYDGGIPVLGMSLNIFENSKDLKSKIEYSKSITSSDNIDISVDVIKFVIARKF